MTGSGYKRLRDAVRLCAPTVSDAEHWRILSEMAVIPGVQTDESHAKRAELDARLERAVLDRLRSGEWVAWGCWLGSLTPAELPKGLWERSDIRIDLWAEKAHWKGGAICRLTICILEEVDAGMIVEAAWAADGQGAEITQTAPLPPTLEKTAGATNAQIEQFVADYVKNTKTPSQRGLAKAWTDAGKRGHRDELREALAAKKGNPPPGRPPKS